MQPPPNDTNSYLENLRYLSVTDKLGQTHESRNQNIKSLSEITATSGISGHLKDHISSEAITHSSFPSSFPRQSSALGPSLHGSTTNSPKLGASFNNAGFSLPTSPSNFSPNLDVVFKPDNFVCSSPKQTRKSRNSNHDDPGDFLSSNLIPRSPSLLQSSTNPGHRSKTQNVFDFEQSPASYSSPGLFNSQENSGNLFKMNSSAHELRGSLNQVSQESNSSNKESFIAQVTRDLAKMSTVDKCLSESASPSRLYGDSSFNLFKS